MIELRSLGHLATLDPRAYQYHLEAWAIFPNVEVPDDGEHALGLLGGLASELPPLAFGP